MATYLVDKRPPERTPEGKLRRHLAGELKYLLNSAARNLWIRLPYGVNVYVRKATRRLPTGGGSTAVLDIANIDVAESNRGKGYGMLVINAIHENNPYAVTFIESLLNEHLHDRLRREGWIDDAICNGSNAYKYTGK